MNGGVADEFERDITQQLVIECAKTEPDPVLTESLIKNDINWDSFFELVTSHGTANTTFRYLNENWRSYTPEWIIECLADNQEQSVKSNLRYMETLLTILEDFADNDIAAIPYKGPVLTQIGYDDLSLRQFGDLDILLRREDLSKARRLLDDRGYQPSYWLSSTEGLSPSQENAYTKYCRDYRFENGQQSMIELHWKVVTTYFPTSITLDSVWDRRDHLERSGQMIPILSPEDRMLMLSVHGSRHNWARLQWIADVARVAQRQSIDWELTVERAREQNCRRLFALGPLLAARIFDIDLPGPVARLNDEDEKIRVLCEQRRARLFNPRRGPDSQVAQSKMLDSPRAKLKFWLRYTLQPRQPEVEMVSFPEKLHSLYSVVRMGRLCGMAGDKLRRSVS